jgi:hypothetical protein
MSHTLSPNQPSGQPFAQYVPIDLALLLTAALAAELRELSVPFTQSGKSKLQLLTLHALSQ